MTGVKWQDGVSSKEVAKKCGLGDIQERTRQGRLQWFGHVRRAEEECALRKVEKMQVTGNRLPERLMETLEQLVQRDMKKRTKRAAGNESKKLEKLIKGLPIAGK